MSAPPVQLRGRRRWSPDPVRQRLGSYTIEDVLALPDDAPRVELRDGVMIVVPVPTFEHQRVQFLVQRWLYDNSPSDVRMYGGVGVALDLQDTFEPDILLLRGHVSGTSHYVLAEQLVLVVEIVSAGTQNRDRIEKPAQYADLGVAHYWRIEQNPVHVYAYELGRDGAYKLTADSDTELVLERPFPIRMSIGDITP